MRNLDRDNVPEKFPRQTELVKDIAALTQLAVGWHMAHSEAPGSQKEQEAQEYFKVGRIF